MYYYWILIIVIILLVIIAIVISQQTAVTPVLESDFSIGTDTDTLKEKALIPFIKIPIKNRLHGSNELGMYNMSVHKFAHGYEGVVRGSSADGCNIVSDAPLFSYTYYISLDNAGTVIDVKLIDLDYNNMVHCKGKFGYESNGSEDPKMFIYNNEKWVVANVLGTKEQPNVCKNAICIFKVNNSKSTFKILKVPDNVDPQRTQKNWSFFEYNGDLLAEYSIQPHIILKVNVNEGTTTELHRSGHQGYDVSSYAALRGNANSIRIMLDNKFYYLGIGHITSGNPGDYKHFFYLFNSEPPFDVIEISEPSKLDHRARIQFVGGLSEFDDNIYVSYGIEDCYNRISIFSKNKMMSLFKLFKT